MKKWFILQIAFLLILAGSASAATQNFKGTLNGLTVTGTTGTFTLINAKVFTVNNTLTLSGTDGSTLNIGTGGTLGTAAYTATGAYEAAGAVADHAALITGIHGLVFAADQTLTVEASSILNQDLTSDASPAFTTVKLSGLIDDYIPYHVSDAAGLANGPTKTNVDSAVSLKHTQGTDSTLGNPVTQGTYGIRKVIVKTGIADNTTTSIFSITTTDEAGSTDGGGYSVKVHALINHGATAGGSGAVKSFTGQFCRVVNLDGSIGVSSAVTEVTETASAAISSANRDIDTVTMTITETSEYIVNVQFLVDTTGTSATTWNFMGMVEIVHWFKTPPTITAL